MMSFNLKQIKLENNNHLIFYKLIYAPRTFVHHHNMIARLARRRQS